MNKSINEAPVSGQHSFDPVLTGAMKEYLERNSYVMLSVSQELPFGGNPGATREAWFNTAYGLFVSAVRRGSDILVGVSMNGDQNPITPTLKVFNDVDVFGPVLHEIESTIEKSRRQR